MKKLILAALVFFHSASAVVYAQNLLTERIWKISSRKRSIFFDQGVFHSDLKSSPKKLTGIRNNFKAGEGFERIVFDFSSPLPAKVYGHISKKDKKLRLDFFNTTLEESVGNVSNVKYIKSIDFYNIDNDSLSVEISFKQTVSFDIFYLENPGRLVIDAKK